MNSNYMVPDCRSILLKELFAVSGPNGELRTRGERDWPYSAGAMVKVRNARRLNHIWNIIVCDITFEDGATVAEIPTTWIRIPSPLELLAAEA